MRFIHTGDIHLGYTLQHPGEWAQQRADEIWGTFEGLIKYIKEEPVDMLIISGDLFDRPPLLRELKEVDYLFSTIPSTKVILMAGNEDAIEKGSFYIDFKWSDNVTFLGGTNIERVQFQDLNVDVYGHSYHSKEIRESLYDNILVENKESINILVGHGGEKNHIPINKRKLAMSGFDYAALGHFHYPDIDERSGYAYCGSLEPTNLTDIGPRGFIYGEVTKESLDLQFILFCKRIYKQKEIEINPVTTSLELKRKIEESVERHGNKHIYTYKIKGLRKPTFEINEADLASLCNLAGIIDETVPNYDFEEIYEDNKDNILGMYIAKFIHAENPLTEHEKKVLYYGTRALMDAMEER